jgi:hypothetical protein
LIGNFGPQPNPIDSPKSDKLFFYAWVWDNIEKPRMAYITIFLRRIRKKKFRTEKAKKEKNRKRKPLAKLYSCLGSQSVKTTWKAILLPWQPVRKKMREETNLFEYLTEFKITNSHFNCLFYVCCIY